MKTKGTEIGDDYEKEGLSVVPNSKVDTFGSRKLVESKEMERGRERNLESESEVGIELRAR
jgi:hypothetical protein